MVSLVVYTHPRCSPRWPPRTPASGRRSSRPPAGRRAEGWAPTWRPRRRGRSRACCERWVDWHNWAERSVWRSNSTTFNHLISTDHGLLRLDAPRVLPLPLLPDGGPDRGRPACPLPFVSRRGAQRARHMVRAADVRHVNEVVFDKSIVRFTTPYSPICHASCDHRRGQPFPPHLHNRRVCSV